MKIGVVIPVYNDAGTIKQTLDALQNQTRKPSVIAVVDNNSSDNLKEVIASYDAKNIKYIFEPRQGVGFARRAGMSAIADECDLLATTDADTLISPYWLETIDNYFEKHLKIDAVSGPVKFFDAPPHGLWTYFFNVTVHRGNQLIDSPWLSGANFGIKSWAWQKIAPDLKQIPHIFDDTDIALTLQRHKLKVGYDNDLLVGTTARRFGTSPLKQFKYALMWPRTYVANKQYVMGIMGYLTVPLFFIFIILPTWFAFRIYDPKQNRYRLSRFFKGISHKDDRINP